MRAGLLLRRGPGFGIAGEYLEGDAGDGVGIADGVCVNAASIATNGWLAAVTRLVRDMAMDILRGKDRGGKIWTY